MNYPVWYLPTLGGGTLIALIAILHVFISHFAVGGGLYLVMAERKGLRENHPGILDFTRRHARFFILVTLVLGAITGVGIWFIIALVQPSATSLLIHNFVFGWAIEWVFFLVEIAAAFIYYYTFGRMEPRTHQTVGWIYFVSAWMSLFVINGILGFMLTPGGWTEDGNFWAGFFNPSFLPALFFRTCIAFLLAGAYAFLTTAFLREKDLKETMTRFSGKWVLASLVAAIPFALWYLAILPEPVRSLISGTSPTIRTALRYGAAALAGLVILSLLITVLRPSLNRPPLALAILGCGLVFMGAFEWSREAARRPYVIQDVMYSNSILSSDLPDLNRTGFLPAARWAAMKDVHEESLTEAGREIFIHQCYACHTVGGINNDIVSRTANMGYPAFRSYLATIHERRYFMPPFAGTEEEGRALAAFLLTGLQGKNLDDGPPGGEGPGETLFRENCLLCHGPEVVRDWAAGRERTEVRQALDHLNRLNPAMPDFDGTPEEKERLADHIAALAVGEAGGTGHDPGEDVFETHCAMCHTLTGGSNPLLPKLSGWSRQEIREALDRLEELSPAMPPLMASAQKKEDLAAFLLQSLQGGAR